MGGKDLPESSVVVTGWFLQNTRCVWSLPPKLSSPRGSCAFTCWELTAGAPAWQARGPFRGDPTPHTGHSATWNILQASNLLNNRQVDIYIPGLVTCLENLTLRVRFCHCHTRGLTRWTVPFYCLNGWVINQAICSNFIIFNMHDLQ